MLPLVKTNALLTLRGRLGLNPWSELVAEKRSNNDGAKID